MSSSNSSPGCDAGTAVDDDRQDPPEAVCPFCGSEDSDLESTFGSEVSKSQYYCNNCHTVFERIKYDGAMPSTGRERDGSR
ncbi:hypothetical protein GCM10008995_07830 [Halobellus salinus]|uniref:PaaD zinc beta ribbon domain-containing protein n=1 Tax=Halobellus salinus TaxID=931585 RepID=A0A830EN48_9EURY|nr:hypothetical protein [Halobellus salinus]GGJ00437.1 hypothetical protein GCM10008995_07830 [Halobellus salinus]SMP01550.1 hypothetical protein SAMN06265347_101124 [Halobellus salinus]